MLVNIPALLILLQMRPPTRSAAAGGRQLLPRVAAMQFHIT
jgi:hypothetical protein